MYQRIFFLLLLFISFQTKAQVNIDSIITSVKGLQITDSLRAKKLTNTAAQYRYISLTHNLIEEAESIAFSQNRILPKVDVYLAWGNYYFFNSNLDKSEENLLKAIQLLEKQKNPLLRATIAYSLSGVYRKKSNIPLAIKTLLNSKTILDNIEFDSLSAKDQKLLITRQIVLYNSLANFYNQMESFEKASDFYEKAFEKAIKLDSKTNAGAILSNKGNLLINTGHYTEALEVLQKAKQLKIAGKSKVASIANTSREIAVALHKTKRYNKALKTINDVISHYEDSQNQEGLSGALSIRGEIFIAVKKYKNAITDCNKAKALSLNTDILEDKKDACFCLHKAYERLGDDHNALINYKIYQEAKDSIFNEKNIKKITQLEMQYRYNKEKQLQQLTTDSKEQKDKATITNLLFGLFTLFLISGLLLWFNHIKNKNNTILRAKNAQITETLTINKTLLKETHHRVKNNLQIVSSLLNMQSKFLEDKTSKEVIKDSQNRIRSMSLIHQHLYQGQHLTSIETNTYFTKLLDSLITSYGIDINTIELHIDIESMLLDVDTAIPLGLIVNELISNAFKHGINTKNSVLYFSFSKEKNKELLLIIRDNGPGISDKLHYEKSTSYGMKLIKILSKKLKAKIDFTNDNGLKVEMKISNYKLAANS